MEILRKGNKLVKISVNADGFYRVSYCQECRSGIADEIETDVLAAHTCWSIDSAKRWAAKQLAKAA
jgi:hypothetical protein